MNQLKLIVLSIFLLSCSDDPSPPCELSLAPECDCNCGTIVETTTGDGGINPYPTTCGAEIEFGESSGTNNGRALIRNNCTNNIRVICTGPVSFTVSGGLLGWSVGQQWCDQTSEDNW